MNLGFGNWEIFVEAKGYKPAQKMALVSELSVNPTVKIVMKKSVQAAVKKKLEKSVSLVDKANQLFAEAKFAEAQELYEQFLEKQPKFYQTHLYIGNCHKEKGEYDQAMAQYRKALEKAPADGDPKDIREKAKIQAAIGDLYIRKNDLKAAQEYFKKSLDLSPEDEILAYNVGEIFFSNNKTREAIHYFQLAASIKPGWADPHLKLGYTYLNSGDYKSAVDSFNKFLELAPDSDQADTIKEVIKSLKDL
jgi:tetratricopeptide (TPR) repeat protein